MESEKGSLIDSRHLKKRVPFQAISMFILNINIYISGCMLGWGSIPAARPPAQKKKKEQFPRGRLVYMVLSPADEPPIEGTPEALEPPLETMRAYLRAPTDLPKSIQNDDEEPLTRSLYITSTQKAIGCILWGCMYFP